jgi:hypothetical protein
MCDAASRCARSVLSACGVVIGLLLGASPARAWTETTVKSDLATVDLERSGGATVAHEIVLNVRGSPLSSFELDGVSADAEPLGDGFVAPKASGSAGSSTTPLLLSKGDDGVLRIEIDGKKGLSQGSYLLKFSYRTNLLREDKIELRGAWVEVRWLGPRFQDGLDSARVVFRVPQTATAPRLPDFAAERPEGSEEFDDTFLPNLRHAPDKDELELVRPHVAKGEPVLWRILVSPKAFDAFTGAASPAVLAKSPSVEEPHPAGVRSFAIAGLVLLALAYAGLVFAKWRAIVRGCSVSSAIPRALIPLPISARTALSGSLLAGSAALGIYSELPTLAGIVFVAAMVLAAHLSPCPASRLRGPGRWLALRDEEAFADGEPRPIAGQWLDAGSLKGFLLLLALVSGIVVGAARLLATSPYFAVMLALSSACLLPIFCMGRASELPLDPATAPRKVLSWFAERLRGSDSIKVVPWARIPDGSAEPDELRLLVVPQSPKAGLVSIEVGLESQQGSGGSVLLPYIIVRARDASPSYEALPRDVIWMRGRKPEERVTVIRPKLPTRAMCLALLTRLLERLSMATPPSRRAKNQPARSSAKSAGSGSSTANAASVASPAQAR